MGGFNLYSTTVCREYLWLHTERHDWGRKEIILNVVPIWVFLLGGGLVFTHVLDLVDFAPM